MRTTKPGRRGDFTVVAYSTCELSAGVSCGAIIEGRARGLFAQGGAWWVVTGSVSGGGTTPQFDAVQAVFDTAYRGRRVSYAERCAELSRLDHADKSAAADLRDRFYDGMPVRWQGTVYRLTDVRSTWVPAAVVLARQGNLFTTTR